jgi:hypothetical protein
MSDLNSPALPLESIVRILSMDLEYMGRQLDAAQDRGDDIAAVSIERSWLVKEGLLADAKKKLDQYRSDAARRSAEARAV